MNCHKHSQRLANGRCKNCGIYLCSDCFVEKKFGTKNVFLCPECRDLVQILKEAEAKIPFLTVIKNAFIFPTAPGDRMRLAGFAIFLGFYAFMKMIMPLNPIIYANWAVGAFLWGVFLSYIIKSTKTVGEGKLALPDWPDFTYYMDDLIIPSVKVALTSFVLIFLPLLLGMSLIGHQIGLGIFDIMGGFKGNKIEQQMKEEAVKEQQKMMKLYGQIYEQQRKRDPNSENEESNQGQSNFEQQSNENFQKRMEEMFREESSRDKFFDTVLGSMGFKKAAERMPLIVLYLIFFGILSFIGTLLWPMGYYIAAGYQSLMGAINPVLLVKLIGRAPLDYFLLIVMLIVAFIAQIVITFIFGIVGLLGIPFLGLFFSMSINLYFCLVSAYMIGLFAYQNRYNIGFEKYDSEETEIDEYPMHSNIHTAITEVAVDIPQMAPIAPNIELKGGTKKESLADNPHLQKPAKSGPSMELNSSVDENVTKGRELKKSGSLDAALDYFNAALEVNPTHAIALRECFKIYLKKDEPEKAQNSINRLMNHYTQKNKKEEALILFGEVMGVLPMHTFSQQSQKKLSGWLKDIGDFKNAVVAYRNYAYKYHRDPYAATCLLEAAYLCRNNLGNTDLYQKILIIIMNNFPETPEAQRAKDLAKDL